MAKTSEAKKPVGRPAGTKKAPALKATKAPAKKAGRPKKDATTKSNKAETGRATVKTTTATASKKRKVDEEEEQERPAKKARPVKATKPKVFVNRAPTQKLNVYVFGEGSAGELGLGTAKKVIDVKRPRLNPLLPAKDVGVVQVACGGMHVAALTHDNKILTWGVNDQGALGRDTTWEGGLRGADQESDSDSDDDDSGLNPYEATPTAVSSDHFPPGTVFTSLSAGDSSTFAVTDEGRVYGWGTFRNNAGVLGFTETVHIAKTPILIESLKDVTQTTCGANHTLALDTKGQIFVWGNGQQNQLGYRTIERHQHKTLTPYPLRLGRRRFTTIGNGSDHSFAIDKQNHVWSWGANSMGMTGHRTGAGDDNAAIYVPAQVKSLDRPDDPITRITGGAHHSIAVTENGSCLVWGEVKAHQLGLDIATVPEDNIIKDARGEAGIVIEPTVIPQLTGAKFVAAGTDHNIVLNGNDAPFSWGFSLAYQTGQGVSDDVKMPTQIENTAIRGKKITWAGAGGQYSIIAGPADAEMADVEMTDAVAVPN